MGNRTARRIARIFIGALARTALATPRRGQRHDCRIHGAEIGMSDCQYGCKIMRCDRCGGVGTVHNPTYGCRAAA